LPDWEKACEAVMSKKVINSRMRYIFFILGALFLDWVKIIKRGMKYITDDIR
jgi:hypothetical protein